MERFVDGVNTIYVPERKNTFGMVKAAALITYTLLQDMRGHGRYQAYTDAEQTALNTAWHSLSEVNNLIARLNDKIERGEI